MPWPSSTFGLTKNPSDLADSLTCRSRHTRCDEKKPVCGSCERLRLPCRATNLIVSSAWCSLPQDAVNDMPQPQGPRSTWEIFNHHHRPALLDNSRPSTLPDVADASKHPAVISSEAAGLLRRYQAGIAVWMDLFDHGLSHQRGVMRRVFSSPLLMCSVCALTAKQLSMIKSGEVWVPVAARYYGESLRLLINLLADPTLGREDALTATILLSSYEMLAAPGAEHKRHLVGANTLVKAQGINAKSNALERADFWIYIRHDVALALITECPTILSPDDWNVSWADDEMEEDVLGNQMLWLLGMVINLVFREREPHPDSTGSRGCSKLSTDIDRWLDKLPVSFTGARCGPVSQEGFVDLYFPVPAAAAAMLHYHLAKLLLLAEDPVRQPIDDDNVKIQYHADHIASIGLSEIPDGVLVQAAQPLFFAAKHTDSLAKKTKLWALLESIETKLGFHTSSRVKKLQRAAGIR